MSSKRKQKKKNTHVAASTNGDHSHSESQSGDHSYSSYNGDHPLPHSSPKSTQQSKASAGNSNSNPLATILLLAFVFVLGALTGIIYVGWVQHQYGFGKDTSMEQQLLPFGPSTAHVVREYEYEEQEKAAASPMKKSMILNKDHPQLRTSFLQPLFGLNFDNIMLSKEHHPKLKRCRNDYDIDVDWYQLSYTRPVVLQESEKQMIQQLALRMHEEVPHIHERAAQVSWGGPHQAYHETNWWYPAGDNALQDPQMDLDVLDGGHLLYAYLFIMKWDPKPKFPFRLCGQEGCPPERAILHSLEWREKYKPWLVPPSLIQENAKGYVYHRGFSPEHFEDAGRHGTVWIRVGHQVQNDLAFFRGILNAADRAIAASLKESGPGKFNVIFDCRGFSFSNTPTLKSLKQAVTMLQDHYPNRLGMIFLAHISRPGEVFLRTVLRLITKEVRDKVKILPTQDKEKSLAILRMVVEEHHIPDWLEGTDEYRFHTDDYYPHYLHCTEEEAQVFLTTMPYHAN